MADQKPAPWQATFKGRREHYAKTIEAAGFHPGGAERPATEKQRDYIKRLNFQGRVPQRLFNLSEWECLTADEAAQVIEAAKRAEAPGRPFVLLQSAYMYKRRLMAAGLTEEQADIAVRERD